MRALMELTALTPGTTGEALDYAMREAESPEAQEFTGGHGAAVAIVLIGFLVLLYLYLKKEGKV